MATYEKTFSQKPPGMPPGMQPYPIYVYQQPQSNYMGKADNMLLKCGTFATYFSAATCCIILICVTSLAIYMYTKKEEELIKINAVITDRICNTYYTVQNGKNVENISCIITVKYTIDDKEYTNSFETNDNNIFINQTIQIEYVKRDPNIIHYKYMHAKTIGMIFFGLSACILFGMIIHLILLNVSDWYKRLQCINMLSQIF